MYTGIRKRKIVCKENSISKRDKAMSVEGKTQKFDILLLFDDRYQKFKREI